MTAWCDDMLVELEDQGDQGLTCPSCGEQNIADLDTVTQAHYPCDEPHPDADRHIIRTGTPGAYCICGCGWADF